MENSPQRPKETRRFALKTFAKSAAAVAGATILNPTQQPKDTAPVPGVTKEDIKVKVVDAIEPPSEPLDPRYTDIAAKAAQLEELFPKEFSGGKKLQDKLQQLWSQGNLLNTESPLGLTTMPYTTKKQDPTTGKEIMDKVGVRIFIPSSFLDDSSLPISMRQSLEEKAMLLMHEVAHVEDMKAFLHELLVSKDGYISYGELESALQKKQYEWEAKELWRNCEQIRALKSTYPNFKTSPISPFENDLSQYPSVTAQFPQLAAYTNLYATYLEVIHEPDHTKRNPQNNTWLAKTAAYVAAIRGRIK